MTNDSTSTYRHKILTIPNVLSFFRLCLIPVIVWLYCVKKDPLWTTLALALSGLTDVVDGIIARQFHMVSDFGKAFDPVADKLAMPSSRGSSPPRDETQVSKSPPAWKLSSYRVIRRMSNLS